MQIQMLEGTSYNGVYVWKIDHFSRRFQEAVSGRTPSIYSPPFYVGRFGYKVCARLYPNGDGIGKGTHMSMFFVIMRGEHDALLPWPFIQKVHFRLLDQSVPILTVGVLKDPRQTWTWHRAVRNLFLKQRSDLKPETAQEKPLAPRVELLWTHTKKSKKPPYGKNCSLISVLARK